MADHSKQSSSLSALFSQIAADLNLDKKNPVDATAWFLGPKAENAKALHHFVELAVNSQVSTREEYMPEDPDIFTDYEEADHQKAISIIEDELNKLLAQLKASIPLASYRNLSHMYWDITLPGAVGYFAAMLYNQNNVAAEASPVTTLLEIQVGNDLCEMLGFNPVPESDVDEPIIPWGHITCDGSIANGESMWAARNLKFLPVAMSAAIKNEQDLELAKSVTVRTSRGSRAHLIDLNIWELLNLQLDDVIYLVKTVCKASGLEQSIVRELLDKYSLQNLGLIEFQHEYLESFNQATPVVFVPATAHYSWSKTGTLIGLGTQAIKHIEVDLDGRMSMVALRRELDKCLQTGRPVLQVVAVMGTTEEGAIDPLLDIVRLRKEYQAMGLNFVIHVDGAWGGYFTSILRKPGMLGSDPAVNIDKHPELYVSDYFKTQFSALPYVDSVTLDPHKSGFIPYPAGGLCYRNGDMRYLIAFTAPVVYHDGTDVTVGSYGIEGSKPGAAAASVYLSHKVIPLNTSGYGRMLGRCLFNSKRFYAALVSMDLDEDFVVVPFQRLPIEKQCGTHHQIIQQKEYLREHIVQYSTQNLIEHLMKDEQALDLFQEIGSDLSIVAYVFNFKTRHGLNHDLALMNELNEMIFRKLSLQPNESGKIPEVKMFVTSSSFDPAAYGDELVRDFARRSGVEYKANTPIRFLISTTQNPWLSTTAGGTNMVDVLIEVLRETVKHAAKEIIEKYELDKRHSAIKETE